MKKTKLQVVFSSQSSDENKESDHQGSDVLIFKQILLSPLTLSLPESIMKTSNASLTFESVNEILWCDHSIVTSLAVLSLGTICFSIFSKRNLECSSTFSFGHYWE